MLLLHSTQFEMSYNFGTLNYEITINYIQDLKPPTVLTMSLFSDNTTA